LAFATGCNGIEHSDFGALVNRPPFGAADIGVVKDDGVLAYVLKDADFLSADADLV
jgi:hypothetical protein